MSKYAQLIEAIAKAITTEEIANVGFRIINEGSELDHYEMVSVIDHYNTRTNMILEGGE